MGRKAAENMYITLIITIIALNSESTEGNSSSDEKHEVTSSIDNAMTINSKEATTSAAATVSGQVSFDRNFQTPQPDHFTSDVTTNSLTLTTDADAPQMTAKDDVMVAPQLTEKDKVMTKYSPSTCGPDGLSIAGQCYIYVDTGTNLSWYNASVVCLLRGTHLASLTTPDEWRNVAQYLEQNFEKPVYIGLKSSLSSSPLIYQNVFQWLDGTMAFFANLTGQLEVRPSCAYFDKEEFGRLPGTYPVFLHPCQEAMAASVLCNAKVASVAELAQAVVSSNIEMPRAGIWRSTVSHVRCPAGHMTHMFLACDVMTHCWLAGYGASAYCNVSVSPQPPYFMCANEMEWVAYTLVCNHKSDCRDGSDEDFCVFPPCDAMKPVECGSNQCISQAQQCDGARDCYDQSDESQCFQTSNSITACNRLPPAVVHFSRRASANQHTACGSPKSGQIYTKTRSFTADELQYMTTTSSACPEAHFACPGASWYCLPVYLRCNGVSDCPGHEDEVKCDVYNCTGFYRCRSSRVCLHHTHICDGVSQCPEQDDELFCDISCPNRCKCFGMAFYCTDAFPGHMHPTLRYLDAHSTSMILADFTENVYLIYLRLSACNLTELNISFLPNLQTLDVSDNLITSVSGEDLRRLPNLKSLSLSGNPLLIAFHEDLPYFSFPKIINIDISRVYIPELDPANIAIFPNVQVVNLSGCQIDRLLDDGFQQFTKLRLLDLHGCPLNTFPRRMLQGLTELQALYADNFKLCCPQTLPEGFELSACQAPLDDISSCESLLRSDIYRAILAIFAILALLGNLSSFFFRTFCNRKQNKFGFDVFVTSLCLADFAMGLYLAIIGIADRMYLGVYVWHDVTWRRSMACKTAGFLSLLSSEVSALSTCLITLDRFLVLRFPLSPQLHFGRRSARVACVLVWVAGFVIASIPLMPMTSHWHFYSQNGICIPLPITKISFAGHNYSFGVMIVLNFVLFLLIAAGQGLIYWSIQSNSISVMDPSKKARNLTIARRLVTVAFSDFFCWFPIGFLGLMASNGTYVPEEVNVAMAIIILPFNSALNPFLYTFNVMLEGRRGRHEKQLQTFLISKENQRAISSNSSRIPYTRGEAQEIFKAWLDTGLLSQEAVLRQLSLARTSDAGRRELHY